MSYILDALKKAEQDRRHGKAPTLFAVQSAELPVIQPRLVWPWILGLVLLLAVAAFLYWQMKNGFTPLSPINSPPVSQINTAPEATLPNIYKPLSRQEVSARELPPVNSLPPKMPALPAAEKTLATVKEQQNTTSSSVNTSPAPIAITVRNVEDRQIPRLADLPLDVQQNIPKLSMGMHMYSPVPANRLVSINDKTLHEGDLLAPGLKLLEVLPDGAVISYKEYRFKKGIK